MCAPPQPLPLTDGTDRDVWRHEQQVAELSTAEVEKHASVLMLKETLRMEQAKMLQKAFGVEEASGQLQPHPTLRREVRLCPRSSETQQAGLTPRPPSQSALIVKTEGHIRHLAFPTDFCTPIIAQHSCRVEIITG